MKTKLNKILLASCLTMGAMGVVSQANAAGTLAGTTISNTANLAFSIGGVAQTPKNSNTTSFVVDRKINMVLVEDNGGVPLIVTPGSDMNIYRFKLTNLGNAPTDFAMGVVTQFPNGTSLFGLTDAFDASCGYAADQAGGVSGTFEGADKWTYFYSLAPDATSYGYAYCSIPATAVNGAAGVIGMSVQAVTSTGGPGTSGPVVLQTTGANTTGVDVVFADIAGTDDAARDGKSSARGVLLVKSATLTVAKTVTPLCDPFNFNTDPKNIPGAYVRYSIAVTNAADAGASAILNNITDNLATTRLTFDSNLIAPTASSCDTNTPPESAVGVAFKVSCTGGTRACTTTPMYKTAVAGDDGFQFATPTITAGLGVALPAETGYLAGELKAGETVRVEFNALVK